jgi:1-acyl-sn-glycerol-3-phosphate acyltransferase
MQARPGESVPDSGLPGEAVPTGTPPQTYEPLEPEFLRRLMKSLFGPIISGYFRARLIGARNLPRHGPAILAANHSGSSFPYDGMALDGLIWYREGMRTEAKCRSVYAKVLSVTWWMRPFGIDNFWRRCGGVDMTFDNFDRLLARGDRVLYSPEGVPGIGKGFARRYQLQRFSSSFVTLAARHRAPVIPISVINAEWVIPFSFMIKPLDRLMERLFKVPFLPLPAGPLAVTFPFLWYLALPARMIFVIGKPIDVAERVRAAGITDLDNPDRERIREVTDDVQAAMQERLTALVERYGRWPYQGRSLWREIRRRRRRYLRLGPWAWVWGFPRLDRDQHRPPAHNALHALLRDWDLLLYYLPLGWPLLSLARRLRKPPCGYRGLSSEERREREGTFTWNLAERPLPPRDDQAGEARSAGVETPGGAAS